MEITFRGLVILLVFAFPASGTLEWQTLTAVQLLLSYISLPNVSTNTTDVCSIEPQPCLTLVCYEDSITQLHVSGPLPSPSNFSSEDLFTTLGCIPTLKVLSLVSIGLHGPFPSHIGKLPSLEILNVSWNGIDGSIPKELSALTNLQTVVLDNNKLTGQFPDFVGSLPLLAVLSLKNNSLSGILPLSVSNAVSLRILVLSMNNFSGQVPNLLNLTNLQVLELDNNNFGSHFPGLPRKLVSLTLRANRFRSGLPSELNSFYQLKKMDLSSNQFTGLFFPSLLSLPSVVYLDISSNRFRGVLYDNTSCNSELAFVNLSSNLLTGELPSCLRGHFRNKIVHCVDTCLSNGEGRQLPISDCHNEALAAMIRPNAGHTSPSSAALALVITGVFISAIFMSGMFLFIWKKQQKKRTESPRKHTTTTSQSWQSIHKTVSTRISSLLTNAGHICEITRMEPLGLPPYRVFTIQELKEATDDFSMQTLLAESLYGKIYKGILPGGDAVCIKCLVMRRKLTSQAYTHHFEQLSKLRHFNLVSVLGHGFEYHQDVSGITKIFLVFEFVPNITLRDWVSSLEEPSKRRLNWMQRIGAMIGLTKGFLFLHTAVGQGIFSNNVKITDVLLDVDFQVKISKYNLRSFEETPQKAQTIPYTCKPAESASPREKRKDTNDIYDFGIILLETIVGKPIILPSDVGLAKDRLALILTANDAPRTDVMDPILQNECCDDSLKTMIEICLRCLRDEPNDRPSVEDVLWNLHFAAQVQDSWQKSSQSQSPRALTASLEFEL